MKDSKQRKHRARPLESQAATSNAESTKELDNTFAERDATSPLIASAKLSEYPVVVDTAKKDIRARENAINDGVSRSKPCDDFDQILEVIGSEGKFQKILLYGIICPMVTISPFLTLNTIFLWDIPDHHCFVPVQYPNVSLEEWKNITLPWERGPDGLMRHSQCKMIDQTNGSETGCQFGWIYDKSDYESTIPSEYNWVCDKDQYATECFTYDGIGRAIGTLIFGILADKFGRKPIFFFAVFINILFKAASLYLAHNITIYKILQFLAGLAFPTFLSMPVVICAEISGAEYRSWIYSVTWMIRVLGHSLMPLVAWICRDWFIFGWICAASGTFLFLYYPILHESPRWFITAGKGKRATKIILKIAKANGKNVDAVEVDCMVQELERKCKNDKQKHNVGVWTLFSKYRIAKNTTLLIITWVMNTLLYYGVTLNATRMAGNRFINYFPLSLIELPGGWLAGKLAETTGRRWTHSAFLLVCTFSCLICAVAVAHGQTAIVIIGALGIKFGVSITSLVANLQGTEIFPTPLRSTGAGLATTVCGIIGVLGPYIVYSGTMHVSLPYGILCLCGFLGVLSSVFLPETYKQKLPETVEDASRFGKGQRFWSYLPSDTEREPRCTEYTESLVNKSR